MEIREVKTIEEAKECNKLLTMLINDEANYNENVNTNFVVANWFEKSFQKKENVIYIAVDNKKIIGYCYLKISSLDDTVCIEREVTLDGLYVKDSYRNQKIASKLLDKAKEWSIKQGAKYINLEVLDKNDKAINLYKKNNFEKLSSKLRLKLK